MYNTDVNLSPLVQARDTMLVTLAELHARGLYMSMGVSVWLVCVCVCVCVCVLIPPPSI